MLLVIDVGNTNIVLGLFADSALKGTFRLTTKQARTSDEYGMLLTDSAAIRDVLLFPTMKTLE